MFSPWTFPATRVFHKLISDSAVTRADDRELAHTLNLGIFQSDIIFQFFVCEEIIYQPPLLI